MIRGIEHIGIVAENTDALKDWYVKLFGFKVVYENNKTPKTYFLYVNDGSMIEIYPAEKISERSNNRIQGIRHIALIPVNFEDACKVLYANKVEILEEAKVSPSGVKTIFFRDIEGNIMHFIHRPEPLA